MARLAIHIVTFNSAERVDTCLSSLFHQDLSDAEIRVWDNGSTDATLERLRHWERRGVEVRANGCNLYYARAHNLAIRASRADFILTLNPDAALRPGALAALLAAMEQAEHAKRIGAVNGKLLLTAAEAFDPDLICRELPSGARIDSAGLLLRRSGRPYLRGYLREASRFCLEPALIFGADGACALYRRDMLEDVAIDGEYFDEDFVIYREDVDLAWRAQLLGWDTAYTPDALGHHIRGFQLGRNRRGVPGQLRHHGVKNGWLLLLKNADLATLLRQAPFLLPYQAKILGGLATVERSSLGAVREAARLSPRMLRKRRALLKRRRRSAAELRQWLA